MAYGHLSLQERVFVETQLSLGLRPGKIAQGLSRARSTIVREIRRNGCKACQHAVFPLHRATIVHCLQRVARGFAPVSRGWQPS